MTRLAFVLSALAVALDKSGLSQVRLADLAGTSKQQINKLVKDQRKMTAEWAQRLAPHLGASWPSLMGWDPQQMAALGQPPVSDASYLVLRGTRYTAFSSDAKGSYKLALLGEGIRFVEVLGELFVHDADRERAEGVCP